MEIREKRNIFIGKLPDQKHFCSLQSNAEGKWLWEDKATSTLRISSLSPNPWDKDWLILVGKQKQKADSSEFPYRLLLSLKPPADGQEGILIKIERKMIKSVFAWSDYEPLRFYAFLRNDQNEQSIPTWVFYMLLPER